MHFFVYKLDKFCSVKIYLCVLFRAVSRCIYIIRMIFDAQSRQIFTKLTVIGYYLSGTMVSVALTMLSGGTLPRTEVSG